MTTIDKVLVKKQFDCGLNTYSQEALVQKYIAKQLMFELCSLNLPSHSRLFEIGCGTGFLTQNVIEHLKVDELIVNDIASTSKRKIQELEMRYGNHIKFIEGDAEEIDFPQQLDAAISGSTIQWFKNKQHFFDKVYKSLKPNGVLAFSSFGCDNYKEIKLLTGVGLDYLCLNELTEMLSDKFKILSSSEWLEEKEFDTPINVLRHMKQIGVNGIRQSYFGKKQLNDFTEAYQQQFSNDSGSVKLTYNPIMIIAQKK